LIDDMPRQRPPHLHRELTRHGKAVWYVRVSKGLPRIRIRAEYGTEDFKAEYAAAVAGTPLPKPGRASRGTLEWLWMLYRQSGAWLGLSRATRRQRENIMLHVLKSAGAEPLSEITRKVILAGRDRRAATPSQAKNFISTMRGLFIWAVDGDLMRSDPTQGIRRLKRTKPATGFPVWTDEEITAFERRWPRGTRERVIFDVFLYTGLRRGDAARLGKQHIRDGCISIDTEKTGMRVTIPIMPELVATLEAGPLGTLAIIASPSGNPLEKESLGNLFREACRTAGVNKSAHGLRKAAATNAANRGATVSELEAIFGWAGGQMASLYTRSANRTALAMGAANKLSRSESETSTPAPHVSVRARAENGK
jgi:integrase